MFAQLGAQLKNPKLLLRQWKLKCPDIPSACLITFCQLFFWPNLVVSVTSLNFVHCSPADVIQVCKHFHNTGLHLHFIGFITNAVAAFKGKHCDFSKPLCPCASSGQTSRASPAVAFILFFQPSLCGKASML